MKENGILILHHVRVEDANAISGMTWGFPAITQFLGFVHSLSRNLSKKIDTEFTGCGIVCHSHQVQAHQPNRWGDYAFALTRNPLIFKNGKVRSPSFAEEGRMHMDVSLVIPCTGDFEDSDKNSEISEYIKQQVFSKRLAGGTICSIGQVDLLELHEDEQESKKDARRQFYQLLPGFALVQRSELLSKHVSECQKVDPDTEPLDALLDFSAVKYKAEQIESTEKETTPEVKWQLQPNPKKGWLVPILVGYRGISDLYEPGKVQRVRDNSVPFRFVESVYTIGEWLSPHRLTNFNQIIWRYSADPESGWYLTENKMNQ
jgi:CRISPR-associated protein Csy2